MPPPQVAETAALDQHSAMRTVAFLLVVLLAAPARGGADDCPFAISEFDKIDGAINDAPTCAAGAKVFRACLVGASSDVARGGAVQERCERDFLKRLPRARLRAYNSALDACARKYARMEGSMYQSAAAVCAADVAERYSRESPRR